MDILNLIKSIWVTIFSSIILNDVIDAINNLTEYHIIGDIQKILLLVVDIMVIIGMSIYYLKNKLQ